MYTRVFHFKNVINIGLGLVLGPVFIFTALSCLSLYTFMNAE